LKSAGMRIRKPKERGEWAELCFMAKAAELGFKLSKPWGDSAAYDVAIEHAGHFLRVQVKSTMCKARARQPHHQQGAYMANMRHISVRPYRVSDFDFLALYVIPKDVWYVFPSSITAQRAALRVVPGDSRNRYERYQEAWHLLRDPKDSNSKTARGVTLHAVEDRRLTSVDLGAHTPSRSS
jgi:PD-(D/E)XK nuclease superfamily protein